MTSRASHHHRRHHRQVLRAGLREAGMGVDLPRAITSENPVVRAGSVALSKVPWVGAPLDEAVRAVPSQIGGHVENIAEGFSPKLPENIVGGGIEQTLSGAAQREAAGAQATAEAGTRCADVDAWERENQAREQAITSRQAQANNAATRAFGDVAPMEMAQDTISDVQDAAQSYGLPRERIRTLYSDVNDLDASGSAHPPFLICARVQSKPLVRPGLILMTPDRTHQRCCVSWIGFPVGREKCRRMCRRE